MKLIYLLLIFLLFVGCATQKNAPVVEEMPVQEYVSDIVNIPQEANFYVQGMNDTNISTLEVYEEDYFRAWNLEKIDVALKDAMWAYDTFKVGDSYGENFQLLEQEFFDASLENSNFDEYATLNLQALTLENVNIRAFPTEKPLLRDPNKAGEGFPFDYLQNTTIAANKPLLVSHYSKDRKWAFVESSFAFGWLEAKRIVLIEKEYTQRWQRAEQIVFMKDNTPIYDEEGNFLFNTRIGMMLPLIHEEDGSFTILTVSSSGAGKAYYNKSTISKKIANKGILEFNKQNISAILNELMQTNYGWGGVYGQRDCSSTLRDFYAPFGLWLPRNSYQQSKIGHSILLDDLSEQEVLENIKRYAKPFETLLYKQGHIVMFVGIYNNEIIVFQNVWGVKTKKEEIEGRFVIGKPIFSTLEAGKNLKYFDNNESFLKKIKSLNRVTTTTF